MRTTDQMGMKQEDVPPLHQRRRYNVRCENNLEEQEEELQPRQQSYKRNWSPGEKVNLRKQLRQDPP